MDLIPLSSSCFMWESGGFWLWVLRRCTMSWMLPRGTLGSNFGLAENDKTSLKWFSSVLSSHRRIFSDLPVTPFNIMFLVLVLSTATARLGSTQTSSCYFSPSLAPRTSLDDCRIFYLFIYFFAASSERFKWVGWWKPNRFSYLRL